MAHQECQHTIAITLIQIVSVTNTCNTFDYEYGPATLQGYPHPRLLFAMFTSVCRLLGHLQT